MTGAPFDLAVRGGTVVRASGRAPLDLYVREGRIAAVRSPGDDLTATITIDAGGLYVLPGMVDTHVHLMDPGDPLREDFPTGTAAAVANGVTTIIEHTHGWPVTSVARLDEKRAHLRGLSHADYGLAAHLWDDNLADLPDLWRAGVAFFKIFTCATHGVPATTSDRMLAALQAAAELDALCLVHCENDLITAWNERVLHDQGRTDGGVIPAWRSREAELVATATVALLARLTTARVAIAHVSHPDVLALIDEQQRRGARLVAETCPQYLLLREDEVIEHGALRKFTPPARIRNGAEAAEMWTALRDGRIHHLSTDHAPSTRAQKSLGVWESPFGLPGLDSTLPLMLDAGLSERLSLERLVEVYAQAPARWYGLSAKGDIGVGYDADLVLVDPHGVRTLTDEAVISRAGWTPHAGRTVRGAITTVLLRGRVVAEGGRPCGSLDGRFVAGPGGR